MNGDIKEVPNMVSAPSPPEDRRELSALSRLTGKLKNNVEQAIGARFPAEVERQAQLSHMPRVAANVDRYVGLECRAKNILPSGKEKNLVGVFAWGHDAGKFLDDEIMAKVDGLNETQIQDVLSQMELTEEEKWIFAQAVSAKRSDQERLRQGGKPGYNREWDIAHNLLSAFYLEASDFLGEGGNLKPETKKLIRDMVIAHQFSGYYQDRAKDLGWEDRYARAINAITRFKIASADDYQKLMLGAAKSGDIIEMLAIGETGPDGKFTPGGLVKILNLSLNKEATASATLALAISSVRRSTQQVVGDLDGAGCASAIEDGKLLFEKADNFLNALSQSQIPTGNDDINTLRQHILASAQKWQL
jgi:hypothetical protein